MAKDKEKDKEQEQRERDRKTAAARREQIEAEEEETQRKIDERKALHRAKQEAEAEERVQLENTCKKYLGVEILPRGLFNKISSEPETIRGLTKDTLTAEQITENLSNLAGVQSAQQLSQEDRVEQEVYSLRYEIWKRAKIVDPKKLNVITQENVFDIEKKLEDVINQLSKEERENEDTVKRTVSGVLDKYKPTDTRELAAEIDGFFDRVSQSGIVPLTSGKKVVILNSGIYKSFAKKGPEVLEGRLEESQTIDLEELRRTVQAYPAEKQKDFAEKMRADFLDNYPALEDYINEKFTLETPEDVEDAALIGLYIKKLTTERSGKKVKEPAAKKAAVIQAIRQIKGLTDEEEENWKEVTAQLDRLPSRTSKVVEQEAELANKTTGKLIKSALKKAEEEGNEEEVKRLKDAQAHLQLQNRLRERQVILKILETYSLLNERILRPAYLALPEQVRNAYLACEKDQSDKNIGKLEDELGKLSIGIAHDTVRPLERAIASVLGYDPDKIPVGGIKELLASFATKQDLEQYVTREECEKRIEQYEQTTTPVLPAEPEVTEFEEDQPDKPAKPSKDYSETRTLKSIRAGIRGLYKKPKRRVKK